MPLDEWEDGLHGREDCEVELLRQVLTQRAEILIMAKRVMKGLYLAAALIILACFCVDEMREQIVEHPHMMCLPMALLIIPSVLLWGMLRSVFHLKENAKPDFSELAQGLHPIMPS